MGTHVVVQKKAIYFKILIIWGIARAAVVLSLENQNGGADREREWGEDGIFPLLLHSFFNILEFLGENYGKFKFWTFSDRRSFVGNKWCVLPIFKFCCKRETSSWILERFSHNSDGPQMYHIHDFLHSTNRCQWPIFRSCSSYDDTQFTKVWEEIWPWWVAIWKGLILFSLGLEMIYFMAYWNSFILKVAKASCLFTSFCDFSWHLPNNSSVGNFCTCLLLSLKGSLPDVFPKSVSLTVLIWQVCVAWKGGRRNCPPKKKGKRRGNVIVSQQKQIKGTWSQETLYNTYFQPYPTHGFHVLTMGHVRKLWMQHLWTLVFEAVSMCNLTATLMWIFSSLGSFLHYIWSQGVLLNGLQMGY